MSHDISLQKIIDENSGFCTQQEAEACTKLLATITSDKPDQFQFLILEFDDGSSVEISIWDDQTAISGCTFFLREISKPLVEFIYNMADAGGFVILDSGGSDTVDSPMAMMTSKKVLDDVGQNLFEHPKLCENISELSEILVGSTDEWLEYRDHVVSSYSDPPVRPRKKSFFKRFFTSE